MLITVFTPTHNLSHIAETANSLSHRLFWHSIAQLSGS